MNRVLSDALGFARREYARLDAEIDAQRASADEGWALALNSAKKCDALMAMCQELAAENAQLRAQLAALGGGQ